MENETTIANNDAIDAPNSTPSPSKEPLALTVKEATGDTKPIGEEKAAEAAVHGAPAAEAGAIVEGEKISGVEAFRALGLDERTLEAVKAKGFSVPTPIQLLTIPKLLTAKDNIIAKARTGTGKTAAFGLPLVQVLSSEAPCVKALILEPTRELAIQTKKEMDSFTPSRYPRSVVVYGGAPMGEQLRALKNGVEVVVGTPGRVKDHIERKSLVLDGIDYFILDEADEMLDMGFIEDIEDIFRKANPKARVLLFSATMSDAILKIAHSFMGEYEVIREEVRQEPPLLIKQRYWVLRHAQKIEALVRLIDISSDFYGLVFCQTKTEADSIAKQLDERGYEVSVLHGDIAQTQREKVLDRFRRRKTRVLIATDVAARGIDIEGLTHVVNYDMPRDGETYTHRIGRTGRAGASGTALTFVRPDERRRIEMLKAASRKAGNSVIEEGQIPTIQEVLAAKRKRLFADMRKRIGLAASEDKSEVKKPAKTKEGAREGEAIEGEHKVLASGTAEFIKELIKPEEIFSTMADDLCTGQDAKSVLAAVLSVTYGKALDESRYGKIEAGSARGASRPSRPVGKDKIRIYVAKGRADGYNPKGLAEFFAELLHMPERLVDDIDMAQNFSLVTLPRDRGERAIELSKKDRLLPGMHADRGKSEFGINGTKSSSLSFGWRQGFSRKKVGGHDGVSRGKKRDRLDSRRPRSSFRAPTNRSSSSSYWKSTEEY